MALDRIYIRPYRPSDFPQIRALFFEGFVTSEGSVAVVATRRSFYKFPAPIAYLLGGVGLAVLRLARAEPWAWTSPMVAAGALLCAAPIAFFIFIRRAIPRALIAFCESALAADMRDIPAHYGADGFFVAVQPRDDPKPGEAPQDEEVVGYVGLEYLPEKDPHTAEVRRMVVSAKYRRRGLAERLMRAVIARGETIPGLRSIKLGTSEYQPSAQRLYERLGWVSAGGRTMRVGILLVYEYHFTRPVGKA
ncbi:acyl-CoA N-acyltransferase [Mycena belliarum]|uniref:Acyl-CoA N-acyltransferase n=1 Tax=Mycena belliarum TaxID=1033014 RepID=A0AAD6TTV5_9AGAR|nr:acyl-CoA N-acyltransferase [Mycena belliae]